MKFRRWALLLLLFLGTAGALFLWRKESVEMRFYPEIQAAAKRYAVDPSLVKAVIWRESKFQPHVRGGAGELGLMQIQEVAAQEWADAERDRTFEHEHCLNPATNVLAGTFYLSKRLKRYAHTDNPIPYALADYNAGRGNVIRWNKGAAATNSVMFIESIDFPGTKHYVKSVARRHRLYKTFARFGL
ncbi:MAG TPA: lytic transglycosylase domain-containing protein [Verrucomicrobiae bacterium]|nr:lytic transglycosylase domain-containing protein [Verrucomicrobiae bacterium]